MIKRIFFILALSGFISGCASNHMTNVTPEQATLTPETGKALINCMRPTSFGGAIQSTIYDGDKYIGTVSANTRVCYQAEPGEHMFMVIGESADFLQANLAPDKTYFINVSPRMGAWKARFSLRPMNGQVPQEKIDKWIDATKEVEVNEKGEQWAIENKDSIQRLKNKYYPVWDKKAEKDKQTLKIESGI